MNYLKRFSFLLLLSGSLMLSSCHQNKPKNKPVDKNFTLYINAFTSGVISNSDPVVIELTQVQKVKKGDAVEASIIEFTPSIEGQAVWQNPYTIIFKPNEKWPNGQVFEARLHLDKLMDVPSDLATFKFGFQIKNQALDVQTQGMKAYHTQNLKLNRFEGLVTTADFAGNEQVEACLTAVQQAKEKPIRWTHDYEQKIHHFVIDSILRGDQESQLIIQWNGQAIGAKNKGEKVIKIPSINDFKLMDYSLKNEPDQVIELYFSDPIDKHQNLKGLIRFKNKTPLRFLIKESSIKVYPKQRLTKPATLIIDKHLRNTMGKKLGKTFQQKVLFTSLKPNVEPVSKGHIMPDANQLIYPFRAVNLKAVNVKIIKIFEKNVPQFLQVNQLDGQRELTRVGRIVYKDEVPLKSGKNIDYGSWNVFALDLADLIQVEPGAIYRVEISFTKKQSLYNCPNENDADIVDTNEVDDNTRYDGPGDYYYYYDDDYFPGYEYDQRNNPCHETYYHESSHKIKQNLLASNLGIIAKENGDHSLNIFVSDLMTTENLSNVNIKIYDYQHQLIGQGTTDSNGRAIVSVPHKAFLLIAQKDGQTGYLRLDDGSSLSLSMFNVSGQKVQKGLKAYLFAERGVWRPGDSIYLNAIIDDKNNPLPKNHPVIMEIYNPQNQLFLKQVKTKSKNNFYDFRFATPPEALTGNWQAKLKVGGVGFTKTLKVEAIKPNRLKINLKFNGDIIHKTDRQITLISKWLHGAPASGLRAIVEMNLSKGKTRFKNYEDFHFDDASKSFYPDQQVLFDGKLNQEGKAQIPLKIDVDDAPGMLQAVFKTRVFEKGGDFSIDRLKKMYSPYKSYVGVKIPKGKGWNNALFSDETNLIPIVTLDENGKPVSRKKLKIEIYEISWRWWWQRDSQEDLGYYLQSSSSKKILTDHIDTKNGKAIYELKFPEETWGRKFIKITDPVSGHSTGKIFYTDYKGWWDDPGHKAPGGVEMLTFSTDKDTYKTGDDVRINLPVSEQGKALVSIENGSKLIDAFWVNLSKTNHQISFKTTADMSPNVYVHISYIQPHSQTENDRPIRMYGVQGISVVNPETHLHPVIKMPEELRPESKVSIKVKEQNGQPMTYTLFVVDEGLLDLTRFKTPDPWHAFYAKEALGVKTYDLYNYVMGAFSGQIAGLLAIGGDEDLIETGSKKANRFKPVVKFLGTFDLKKGETATHQFVMPNYIGSVKTMIVAGNLQGAYGHAEKITPVKKPLMVLASLPRVLGPQEKVLLPVTVFAEKHIKDVKVEVTTNDLIKLKSTAIKKIHFDQEGEQMVFFDLEVARKTGSGKVKVKVTGGGEKAFYNINIPVRIANPSITHIQDAVISQGQSWQTDYVPFGIIGTNKAVLEVSSIPPINLEKRLDYLIQYPHGCIEQTTSSVFPQLYLTDLVDLNNVRKAQIQDHIIAGIERLKQFQLTNGGFTYWPGENGFADNWGTNYAGHFLIEAQNKGYKLPNGMLKDWIRYQTKHANDWSVSKNASSYTNRYQQMIQAYRLYTLALAGQPALGAMNRLRNYSHLNTTAKWQLIAAYYLAGKHNVAREMMTGLSTEVKKYQELSYTYGNNNRDEAIILNTLVLLNDKAKAKLLLDKVAANLASDQWMNTQTTAYSLLAVSKFVSGEKHSPMSFAYTNNGSNKTVKTDKSIIQIPLSYRSSGASKVMIDNKGDKTLFVKLYNTGIPLESKDLATEENLKLQIRYLDTNGRNLDITKLKQGTDFVIEVHVTHPGILNDYQNMALTQIFPSGWEITNSRMELSSGLKSDQFTYQDIRDDRIMTYFDLKRGQSKTFRFMANASFAGEFYLPSVKCEAMYDHHILSVTNGKWCQIVK